MRGDALEWAIALAKAPGERMALRQRPLPAGMDILMQIAGGSTADTLTKAAARTGEREEDLQEAARFYLREILFYQGADAYRILGLQRDADLDTIRSHYRLLQQWLHPDRQTSDWDAIFASRVNIAWNQLRTAARRAEYDTQLPVRRTNTRSDAAWLTPARLAATADAAMLDDTDAWHRDRWRRRAPVLALGAVCVILAFAALRDMQRAPPAALDEDAFSDATGSNDKPAVVLQLPKSVAKAPSKPDAKSKPLDRLVASESTPDAGVAPLRSKPIGITRAAPPPPAAPVMTQVDKPAAKPVAVAAVASIASQPPKSPLPAPSTRMPTAPLAAAVAPPRASAKPLALAKTPVRDASATTAATPIKTVSVAAMTPAKVQRPKTPPRAAVPELASANPAPVAETVATRAAPTLPTTSTNATPQQVSQAQQTGRQLLALVTGNSNTVPPIWVSPGVQAQALQARRTLQAGSAVRAGEPHWRVGGSTAAMSTVIKAGDADQQLRVALVWRDQRWLVSSMSVDPAP